MEVNINEIVSNIKAVDSDTLLTPQVLHKIVNVVLETIHEEEAHRKRINWEQQVSKGVRDQLEGEYE